MAAGLDRSSRPPCSGATSPGVTTGVNTSFTSASAAFSSTTDQGQAITETDAQGAFTAGKTVASVTNATTIVLSGNAAAAKANIKVTLARRVRGYSNNYAENTNFSGATIGSHAAADADVAALNTTIGTIAAKFGSMLQIIDMDQALGYGDSVLPANVYSFTSGDNLHPNDLGNQQLSEWSWRAIAACRAESDLQDLGAVEIPTSPILTPGGNRLILRDGQLYGPQYASMSTYTAVAGEMFAYPVFYTESSAKWGATQLELTNTPTTGSTIRLGIYDDFNVTGYPQNLRQEVTALTVGTTTGVRAAGSFANRNPHYGLYWYVIKMDTIVTTAPILRSIVGPVPGMPTWTSAGGAVTPAAWKLTGQGAGALPTLFPSGGTLISAAPLFNVVHTIVAPF